MTFVSICQVRLAPVCLSAVVLALVACGGAQELDKSAVSAGTSSSLSRLAEGGSDTGPASARDAAQLAQGASLSSADLQAAELQAQALDQAKTSETGATDPLSDLKPGQIAPKTAYLSGEVARKAAAVRIPAYRFYNSRSGAHFYTTSETERATVASTLSPPFSFDGPAFSVASDHSAGLASVHRFYNTRTGVHFYTISETERANVVATLPHFAYEGVAYYASQVAGAGLVPLYRFYVPSRGFHFYTASAAEKANIEATLSATYTYEGIGYYVLDTGWADRARLPHTGITTSQCYQAGSNTLVACGGSAPTALNPQQDGHRAAIAPMSYSALPSLFGPYSITSCVRDNVTGLVWEGKTAAGERAGTNVYVNQGQISNPADASGYATAVNASELCGYNDWRLPTRQELLTLVDYGKTTGPSLNTTWFPNTAASRYWTKEQDYVDLSYAWTVQFAQSAGWSELIERSNGHAVRLVRGAPLPIQRFTYSSVSYGSGAQADAANNLVNDAWTGLQWRRCEQGRVWNGSTCTGAVSYFPHEQALAHAREQAGWRLPNVKELASLTDLSVSSGARISPVAFPGAISGVLWPSSPHVGNSNNAWGVSFFNGLVFYGSSRNLSLPVRLVRDSR